ncbi:virion structural protein [Acaryochloris phage A-HIS1]|nr:virion structural protein [Acaryochloris phage A-HIS1]
MAFTDFQKQRIKMHLGLSTGEPSITQLQQDRGLLLDSLDADSQLTIMGDITTNPTDPTHFYYAGVAIAAVNSILYNCEIALERLGGTQIDPSLFVKKAGSVTLRGNELQKRNQFYWYWREQLALVLNYRVIPNAGRNLPAYQYSQAYPSLGRVGYR